MLNEKRYEVINNTIRYMAPASYTHENIQAIVTAILYSKVDSTRCRVFGSNAKFKLDNKDFIMPDFSVRCFEKKQWKLVGEIVSKGNTIFELTNKRNEYLKHGVVEYWQIDTVTKEFTIYFNNEIYNSVKLLTDKELEDELEEEQREKYSTVIKSPQFGEIDLKDIFLPEFDWED